MSESMVAFIYLLIRDELPLGSVARIVQEIEKIEDGVKFTNNGLEQSARDFVRRLEK